MPKKGGKKGNKKGGNKPAAVAAAAVDKVKDIVTPDNDVEDQTKTEQPETVEKTEPETAPKTKAEAPAPAATESPAVAELKEPVKADKAPATEKEGTVDEAVEKVQASKAGQVGELEGGEAAGTAVLPEKTTKEPATLAERPKTAESTAPVVAPVSAPEPIPAPSAESDAAHVKRPYEKPIFNNEENLKPHKMPKTDEEQLAASAAKDKKTIENLAGAGPASTAAYTTPEPVPVKTEAPKVAGQKPEEKIPVETPKSTIQAGKAPASNRDAVAAANAAITSSKSEKAAAPVAEEPKKPEAALKRGEEPLPKSEAPKEGETEQAKADETQTSEPSEATEEKKKKEKGGFLSWLKRKFK